MTEFKAGARVHFVGIGGVSMSALAEWLHCRGCRVSGSDRQPSTLTRRLESLGIPVHIGHDAECVRGVDCVIYTSATAPDNAERKAAQAQGIALLRRAELLGHLTAAHPTVCVAGTHGKTTTTAMIGAVLTAGELDPTVLVGGVVQGLENNLRIGAGAHWVVEADEYDRSFLALHPTVAVVTTLEADHLDCYADLDDIRRTFEQFVHAVPDTGCLVLCHDDPGVRSLSITRRARCITYGLDSGRLRAQGVVQAGFGSRLEVFDGDRHLGGLHLQIPGRHNISNALSAIGVGLFLDLSWTDIKRALEGFRGVHRRFEVLGCAGDITVVDDYAHHPTEIRATLSAARAGWDGRIVAAFQPHLFSRTRDFANDFALALQEADRVWVTEIYPARETPIPGITGAWLAGKIPGAGFAPTLKDLRQALLFDLKAGDLLVVMGAGDIEGVGPEVLKALSGKGENAKTQGRKDAKKGE